MPDPITWFVVYINILLAIKLLLSKAIKRYQNDIQTFECLAFWMKWFDQSFKKNLSVAYIPSVRERAHREILNKTEHEATHS